jgi:hypothetical protein
MKTYIIRAGENGPVKIGRTMFPAERLAALQTGHYEELRIVREIAGDAERELHERFRALRIRREWFHFDPDMLLCPVEPIGKGTDEIMEEYRRIIEMSDAA